MQPGTTGKGSFYADQTCLQFTDGQTTLFQQPVQAHFQQPVQAPSPAKPDRVIYQPPTMQQNSPQKITAPLQPYINTEHDDPLAGILTGRGIQEFHMIQEEPEIPHQETDHDPTENPSPNMISGKRDVETNEYCKT